VKKDKVVVLLIAKKSSICLSKNKERGERESITVTKSLKKAVAKYLNLNINLGFYSSPIPRINLIFKL
jgi:hypothetical protein